MSKLYRRILSNCSYAFATRTTVTTFQSCVYEVCGRIEHLLNKSAAKQFAKTEIRNKWNKIMKQQHISFNIFAYQFFQQLIYDHAFTARYKRIELHTYTSPGQATATSQIGSAAFWTLIPAIFLSRHVHDQPAINASSHGQELSILGLPIWHGAFDKWILLCGGCLYRL